MYTSHRYSKKNEKIERNNFDMSSKKMKLVIGLIN